MSVLEVLSSLICMFAVICVALSLFTPGWLVIGGIREGLHDGLFYRCTFANGNQCEVYSTSGIIPIINSYLCNTLYSIV